MNATGLIALKPNTIKHRKGGMQDCATIRSKRKLKNRTAPQCVIHDLNAHKICFAFWNTLLHKMLENIDNQTLLQRSSQMNVKLWDSPKRKS